MAFLEVSRSSAGLPRIFDSMAYSSQYGSALLLLPPLDGGHVHRGSYVVHVPYRPLRLPAHFHRGRYKYRCIPPDVAAGGYHLGEAGSSNAW